MVKHQVLEASKTSYKTPQSRLYCVEISRRMCDPSPNSTPDMEWGSEYDQEPND